MIKTRWMLELIPVALLSIVFSTGAQAATSIATNQTLYTLNSPQTVSVQASAWYKGAFGTAGWTHFSRWGYISLKAGERVTVTAQTATPGLHPGITIWNRQTGKKYAPIEYFTGHSYNQYLSFKTFNTTDELTGKPVGNFNMDVVANGYDRDGMTQTATIPANSSLNPLTDGVIGKVVVEFRAKKKGIYQFVVGGINPDNTTTTTGGFDNNMTYWPVTITVQK